MCGSITSQVVINAQIDEGGSGGGGRDEGLVEMFYLLSQVILRCNGAIEVHNFLQSGILEVFQDA